MTEAELLTAGPAVSRASLVDSALGRDVSAEPQSRGEALGPLLATVARPAVEVQVVVFVGASETACTAWVSEHLVVIHPDADEDVDRPVLSLRSADLPAAVASMVELGPRPSARSRPFVATAEEVVTACKASGQAAPEPGEPDLRPCFWQVSWRRPGQRDWDAISVLDLRQDGLWRPVDDDGGRVSWKHCTAGEVWQALGALFAAALAAPGGEVA